MAAFCPRLQDLAGCNLRAPRGLPYAYQEAVMSRPARTLLASFTVAAVVTAGGAAVRAADSTGPTGNDQAGEGGKLYGKHCAKCHGEAGQGTRKGPPVVGKEALPLDPPAT